jgi:hypothetical protein
MPVAALLLLVQALPGAHVHGAQLGWRVAFRYQPAAQATQASIPAPSLPRGQFEHVSPYPLVPGPQSNMNVSPAAAGMLTSVTLSEPLRDPQHALTRPLVPATSPQS